MLIQVKYNKYNMCRKKNLNKKTFLQCKTQYKNTILNILS